jgi:tetratricopeptide (TPR) repeat protein
MQIINSYKKVWICLFLCVSNICFASQAEFDAYVEQANLNSFDEKTYAKAEKLYKEAIRVAEKDSNMLNVSLATTGLARLFQYQKNYELAESLYKKSLDINQRYLG